VLFHVTPWRNGSASDSRSEGCVFESRRGQFDFVSSLTTFLPLEQFEFKMVVPLIKQSLITWFRKFKLSVEWKLILIGNWPIACPCKVTLFIFFKYLSLVCEFKIIALS
jgi:hypothetical protein